jgi:hypothetical protein
MTKDTRLEKVNDRLYHQPYKDGKPFKWEKQLRFISVTLTEIRTELCLSIERSETKIRSSVKDRDSAETEEQAYSQDFGWRITGKGHFDGDRLGIIKKDGTLSPRSEQFETVEITLRPAPEPSAKCHGHLGYSDGRYSRIHHHPYIWLEVYSPKSEFNSIREELGSGRLNELDLGVHVDSFESEVDSTLRSPDMPMTVFVEEESYSNKAYLSWLRASHGSVVAHRKDLPQSPATSSQLFQTEGFHEQKINYCGKLLVELESMLKGTYRILIYGALGYVAYKILAGFFHWA